jgi:membrane protein DedA with SNARE-associated domain
MSTATTSSAASAVTGRGVLLVLAAARFILGIVAIPLAPFLFREHFILLVLMRPTKEVFLAAGWLVRQGEVALGAVVLAAIPLSIFGVWLFFFLGRAYKDEIENDDLSGIAGRLITADRVKRLERALDEKGPKLIFLGRLAVMSSAAVAAAAGAAGMETRRFLLVDLAGGLLSIAYTVAAGYFLGRAYESAGPWLTALGVVALVVFAYILGRALKNAGDG